MAFALTRGGDSRNPRHEVVWPARTAAKMGLCPFTGGGQGFPKRGFPETLRSTETTDKKTALSPLGQRAGPNMKG